MQIDILKQLFKLQFVIGIFTIMLGVLSYTHAQSAIEPDQIRRIVWSPNGDRVALSYQNGQIMIIWTDNREETPITFHADPDSFIALAWSPTGDFLATGSTHILRIWDVVNQQEIFTQRGVGTDILTVAWSPDGNQVIAIAAEPFNNPSNAVIVEPMGGQVTPMSLGMVSSIQWSPDGSMVAFTGIAGITVFDATNFQPLFTTLPISREIFRRGLINQLGNITWNSESTHIAGGMGDGRVFVWNLDNPDPIFTFIGHDYQGNDRFLGRIHDLRFDDTGQMLTAVSGDGTIRTWDLRDGTLVTEQLASPNYTADFSPYGGQLVLGLALEAHNEVVTYQSAPVHVNQTLAEGTVQIVVPAPSLEHLQAIAEACNASTPIEQSLTANIQADQLTEFVAQVEALAEDAIPPACRADLLAVAEALQTLEQE